MSLADVMSARRDFSVFAEVGLVLFAVAASSRSRVTTCCSARNREHVRARRARLPLDDDRPAGTTPGERATA